MKASYLIYDFFLSKSILLFLYSVSYQQKKSASRHHPLYYCKYISPALVRIPPKGNPISQQMTSLNRFHFHRSSHSGKIFSNSSSRKFRFSPEARMALESNISLQPLPFLPSCWKWINILQIVGHYDEHIPNPSREVGGSVEFLLENELTSATFLVLGVPPTSLHHPTFSRKSPEQDRTYARRPCEFTRAVTTVAGSRSRRTTFFSLGGCAREKLLIRNQATLWYFLISSCGRI